MGEGEARPRATILARGYYAQSRAKTAHGLVRHGTRYRITSVIDQTLEGKDAGEVMGIGHRGIPIVSKVPDDADALIIGVAPAGGGFPVQWRQDVLDALGKGMDVVSGLHDFLGDDPGFRSAAERGGGRIIDVRRPPKRLMRCADGKPQDVPVAMTMAPDGRIGKRTAALQMVCRAREMGHNWGYVATGQSGVMIGGDAGFTIDSMPVIYASGATEDCVRVSRDMGRELVMVEGQGSLSHHAYSPATFGLLMGARPDAVVMVHDPVRRERHSFGYLPMPTLVSEIALLGRFMPTARVAGIALKTAKIGNGWETVIDEYHQMFGVPVADVVRQDPDILVRGILNSVSKVNLP